MDTPPAGQRIRVAPFGRYPRETRGRFRKMAEALASLVHPEFRPLDGLTAAGPTDRIPLAEAESLRYEPATLGMVLGPNWATWWFRCRVPQMSELPETWQGRPVELLFDMHSEALAYRDGIALQSFNFDRKALRFVPDELARPADLVIEAACNYVLGYEDVFGFEREGVRNRPGPCWLERAELASVDPEAEQLYHDFRVLAELEADREPPQEAWSEARFGSVVRPALDSAWWGHLLCELNRFCNTVDPADRSSWAEGQRILDGLLACRNGTIAHEATAVGHAHIDTAWLWPIDETWRKCVRTFATQLRLIDRYPDYRFVCSQACQYAMVEKLAPELFERIRRAVADGRWIPVGGMWVEPDCNVPSGESLLRQILYGQRYFETKFGVRCRVGWLPDVFGYCGQLPQILRHGGMDRFLTQKLSWNQFTVPQHHTFWWEGLDGSRVLTHFPPADTYNADCSVRQLRYHAANYKENDRSKHAMYVFGWGDGGGGPTPVNLETLARTADLQGVPRVASRTPDAFFDLLEAEHADPRDIPVVSGELYLEYHRGTLTSQARLKRLNLRAECLLFEAEYAACEAMIRRGVVPPRDELRRAWELVLVNQFHDILPGTSIREVVERAEGELREACAIAERVRDEMEQAKVRRKARILFNPAPVSQFGPGCRADPLAPMRSAAEILDQIQRLDREPNTPQTAAAQSELISILQQFDPDQQEPEDLRVRRVGDGVVLEGMHLSVRVDASGDICSLRVRASDDAVELAETLAGMHEQDEIEQDVADVELLCAPIRPLLHPDDPDRWTAWEIDAPSLEAARTAGAATLVKPTETAEGLPAIRIERPLGRASRLVQTVSLGLEHADLRIHTRVEWRERLSLLRLELPLAMSTDSAEFAVQFGAIRRPTSVNDQREVGMFEVPARAVMLRSSMTETDWIGPSLVVIAGDCSYGWSARHRSGGTYVTQSLLRGPTYPDRDADLGEHEFTTVLRLPEVSGPPSSSPAATLLATLDHPVRERPAAAGEQPLIEVIPPCRLVSIKPSEDGDGDVIVRVVRFDAIGSRDAMVRLNFPVDAVHRSNALEDRLEPIEAIGAGDHKAPLVVAAQPLHAGGILTLRVKPLR